MDRNWNILDPGINYRSDLIKVISNIWYDCPINFNAKLYWKIFKINYNNYNESTLINLGDNPTLTSETLVIRRNTLSYGLYRIVRYVEMEVEKGILKFINTALSAEQDTYIKIVPSGIAVFGLENGLDFIKIGFFQKLSLEPLKYSYDMDFLVKTSSLNFNFYCFDIDENTSFKEFSLQNFNLTDEFDLKIYYDDQTTISNSCFNGSSKFRK